MLIGKNKFGKEEISTEELADLIPNSTHWKHAGFYGARKVIDLVNDEVYSMNFNGETIEDVISVNRGEQKPILIRTSQTEIPSRGDPR